LILHRLLGLFLVVLSSSVMVWFSQQLIFPLLLVLLALIGTGGRLQIKLSRERRIILYLVLAVFFQMARRFYGFFYHGVSGFFFYPFFYFLGLYFLTLEVLEFFFFPRQLPVTLVIFGTLVLCSAGNIYASEKQDLTYQWFAISFTVGSAFFLSSGSYISSSGRLSFARFLWRTFVMLAVVVISFSAGRKVREHRDVISRVFVERLAEMNTFNFSYPSTIRLGSVMEFRYRLGEERPVLRIYGKKNPGYLRGKIYEEYRRSEWHSSQNRTMVLPVEKSSGKSGRNFFLVRRQAGAELIALDIWPSPRIEEGMFAPLETVYVLAPVSSLELDEHGIFDAGELVGGFNYTEYISLSPLRENLSPETARRLLSLPQSLHPEIFTLAKKIFQECITVREKIAAVENYFHTNYTYHLGISIPPGQEPLNYFLLKKPPAHCEFFATAATILLRMAGVPTRYVVGFLVEEKNSVGGYWVARQKDAHAWAEAYTEGGFWMIVEATPPEGLPQKRNLSAANYLWDVSSFSLQKFQVFLRVELPGFFKTIWQKLKQFLRNFFLFSSPLLSGIKVVGILACCLFLLRRRKREKEPLTGLQNLLKKVERRLSWQNIRRGSGETLHHFARRLREVKAGSEKWGKVAAWLEDYAKVRYSGTLTPEKVNQLKVGLKQALRNSRKKKNSSC